MTTTRVACVLLLFLAGCSMEPSAGVPAGSSPVPGGKADAVTEEAIDRTVIDVLDRSGVPSYGSIEGSRDWFAQSVLCIDSESPRCTFYVVQGETNETDTYEASLDDARLFIDALKDSGAISEQGYEGDVYTMTDVSCQRGFTGIAGRRNVCRAEFARDDSPSALVAAPVAVTCSNESNDLQFDIYRQRGGLYGIVRNYGALAISGRYEGDCREATAADNANLPADAPTNHFICDSLGGLSARVRSGGYTIEGDDGLHVVLLSDDNSVAVNFDCRRP